MDIFEREKYAMRKKLTNHLITNAHQYDSLKNYVRKYLIEYCYESYDEAAVIRTIVDRAMVEYGRYHLYKRIDYNDPKQLLNDMRLFASEYFEPTAEDILRKKNGKFPHTFRSKDGAQYEFVVKTENGQTYCELIKATIRGRRGKYTVPDCDSEGHPVVGIGEGAFMDNGWVEEIILPKSIKYIEARAFRGCCNLKIPPAAPYERIGDEAFAGCFNFKGVGIPSTTVSIGKRAFADCDELSFVSLGKNVRFVGEEAFAGCYQLTEVLYTGSKSDLDSITFGKNWNRGVASNFKLKTGGFLSRILF